MRLGTRQTRYAPVQCECGRSLAESRRLTGPAGDIMLAARSLFERQGVAKTTVKDVAAEAGVTRELVYYYFENKQAVVDAVLDDYVEDLVESVIVWNESRRFGDTSGSLRACIATFRRALYDAEGNQRPMIAVLEELGVRVERDKIAVDEHYRTNVEGIYAVGDIVPGPALAHVASAEALHCVEHICGVESDTVDYSVIPSCVFTSPEVASVGLTEREALAREIPYTVGRYSFMASGKAAAAGERDGFVKLLFDADRKLIGAHLVGASVTEMLAEPTLACRLGATARQIARTIHAHPTMSEGVMEAAAAVPER